jgi:uncharacterized protein YjlB
MASRSMQHLVDVAHNTDRANQMRAPLEDYRTVNGLNRMAPAIGSGINHTWQASHVQPHAWEHRVFDANHYHNLRHEVRAKRAVEDHGELTRSIAHAMATHGKKSRKRAPRHAPEQ